jgi:hypothetical protein
LENSWIDVQVEASKVDQFTEAVDAIIASHDIGKDVITMHEDLGASIAAETEGMFDEKVSVGECPSYALTHPLTKWV